MSLSFACPTCHGHFQVPESLAGRTARCKQCGAQLLVPEQATVHAVQPAESGQEIHGGGTASDHPPTPDATPEVSAAAASSTAEDTDTKSCPFCAEPIKAAAIKCKHCGERLDGTPAAAVGHRIHVVLHRLKAGANQYIMPPVFKKFRRHWILLVNLGLGFLLMLMFAFVFVSGEPKETSSHLQTAVRGLESEIKKSERAKEERVRKSMQPCPECGGTAWVACGSHPPTRTCRDCYTAKPGFRICRNYLGTGLYKGGPQNLLDP